MGEKFRLMKGNEAIAEAALRAGCRFYAGYPITPQSEILEYMSANMAARGGVFIQGESEIGCPTEIIVLDIHGMQIDFHTLVADFTYVGQHRCLTGNTGQSQIKEQISRVRHV